MVERKNGGISSITAVRGSTISGEILTRLDILGIKPNEKLGQHFLIDSPSIDLLVESVGSGNTVLEIGAGLGQLTESLASKATRVVAVEIDRRFEPILSELSKRFQNLQVVYGDAVSLRLEDYIVDKKGDKNAQIIASLPYHIIEPFMRKVTNLPIESATMVVGKRLADAIQARNEDSINFGRLSLLTQTFFDVQLLSNLSRDKFYPPPRTESAIIKLVPKEEQEFRANRRDFLLRKLFNTSRKSPLVGNVLKEALEEFAFSHSNGTLSKRESNQRDRRSLRVDLKQARQEYNIFGGLPIVPKHSTSMTDRDHLIRAGERAIIDSMGVPEDILGKPFDRLNNDELRILSKALRN